MWPFKQKTIQHGGHCYAEYREWWYRITEDIWTNDHRYRWWIYVVLDEDLKPVDMGSRDIIASTKWGARSVVEGKIYNLQRARKKATTNEPAKWPKRC